MSVTKIARAPMSQSASMTRWASAARAPWRGRPPSPRDAAATRWATRCRGSRRTPRPPARRGCRSPSSRSGVRPGRPAGGGRAAERPGWTRPRPGDQHRLRGHDRLADQLQARLRRVVPVETTSATTSATPSWTAVSTAPSSRIDLGVDSGVGKILRQQPGIRRGDRRPANSLTCRGRAGASAANRKVEYPKSSGSSSSAGEPESSSRSRPVMPTSTRAGADVDRDVPRPQEEELRVVVRVGEDELAAVGPLPVTRLVQHRRGRLGQQPLVGYGDPQRRHRSPRGARRRRQARRRSEHEHLDVVEELGDLVRSPVGALVLGSHPRLGGFLDNFLADVVHSMSDGIDRAGSFGARSHLRRQLGPEAVEALHARQPMARSNRYLFRRNRRAGPAP